METKYVATEFTDNYVMGQLRGDVPNRRLFAFLPEVVKGLNAHNRIGNSITPVKCRVTVQYYFQGTGTEGSQDTQAAALAGLYEVRQLVVASKGVKNTDQWTSSISLDQQKALLENGFGTGVYPDSANPLNLEYPIANEQFTALKGCKKFIMGKNMKLIQQGEGAPLTTARAQNTLHFKVKLPKRLLFEETATVPHNSPTNVCPLFGVYAGVLTNRGPATASPSYEEIIAPTPTGTPTHPILRYNLRCELWYKDD